MARAIQMATAVTAAFLFACTTPPAETHAVRDELAPTGTLRVGIVIAKSPTATLVTLDSKGEPHGVPVDLGRALAARAKLPLQFRTARNTGELSGLLESSDIDVAFLPIDEKRRARLGVGPEYFVLESTYLTGPGVTITSLPEMDRAGVRIAAIQDTATLRALQRMLKEATVVVVPTTDDAVSLVRSGNAQAMAMGRTALESIAARMPGSHVLSDSFERTSTAIAVPNGRPRALQYVSGFMDQEKASGEVDRSLERAGIRPSASSLPKQ